jgi:hypothetical protein
MAIISGANLNITHDHEKKLARAVVEAKVSFTPLELCMMENCREHRMWKLKCELWAADSGICGGDDKLWTYADVFYFPDPTPTASESRTFDVTLGEGVLDEDAWWQCGEDEVYGKIMLSNLAGGGTTVRKTNEVHHSF